VWAETNFFRSGILEREGSTWYLFVRMLLLRILGEELEYITASLKSVQFKDSLSYIYHNLHYNFIMQIRQTSSLVA
jgi:hypothetical protein